MEHVNRRRKTLLRFHVQVLQSNAVLKGCSLCSVPHSTVIQIYIDLRMFFLNRLTPLKFVIFTSVA